MLPLSRNRSRDTEAGHSSPARTRSWESSRPYSGDSGSSRGWPPPLFLAVTPARRRDGARVGCAHEVLAHDRRRKRLRGTEARVRRRECEKDSIEEVLRRETRGVPSRASRRSGRSGRSGRRHSRTKRPLGVFFMRVMGTRSTPGRVSIVVVSTAFSISVDADVRDVARFDAALRERALVRQSPTAEDEVQRLTERRTAWRRTSVSRTVVSACLYTNLTSSEDLRDVVRTEGHGRGLVGRDGRVGANFRRMSRWRRAGAPPRPSSRRRRTRESACAPRASTRPSPSRQLRRFVLFVNVRRVLVKTSAYPRGREGGRGRGRRRGGGHRAMSSSRRSLSRCFSSHSSARRSFSS